MSRTRTVPHVPGWKGCRCAECRIGKGEPGRRRQRLMKQDPAEISKRSHMGPVNEAQVREAPKLRPAKRPSTKRMYPAKVRVPRQEADGQKLVPFD